MHKEFIEHESQSLLCDKSAAVRTRSISRRMIDVLIARKHLPSVKIGAEGACFDAATFWLSSGEVANEGL
jgi:hypothetical protein